MNTEEEKNYIFIERHSQILTAPSTDGTLRRYQSNNVYSGYIDGVFQVLSDTHIGSGSHMNVDGQLVLGNVVDAQGLPIIPASTIKGYLRNMAATIAGDSTSGNAVFSESIFGKMKSRSNISVGETVNTHKQPSTVARVPRRFTPKIATENKRKFYPIRSRISGDVPIAVIPTKTELSWRMTFQNLTNTQLGVVMLSLGMFKSDFAFNVGGAKAFGCGAIRLMNGAIYIRNTFTHTQLSANDAQHMVNNVETQVRQQDPHVLDQIYNAFCWPPA